MFPALSVTRSMIEYVLPCESVGRSQFQVMVPPAIGDQVVVLLYVPAAPKFAVKPTPFHQVPADPLLSLEIATSTLEIPAMLSKAVPVICVCAAFINVLGTTTVAVGISLS